MLTVLKIKNLALVDDLTWEVGPGLVGVTGETGAGKSIIVGALNLILGERADRQLIRDGQSHCSVEAVFQPAKLDEVNQLLENAGLDPCEDDLLVLKRVIGAAGENKQFINCSPATLAVLKRLGNLLVDLHGPHSHQSLLAQDRQLALLDSYAQTEALQTSYQQAYVDWQEATRNYEALRNAEAVTEQEIELLRFQVEEIQQAELRLNEEPELDQRYSLASNSQRLIETASEISHQLNQEPASVLARLDQIQKQIHELERIDTGTQELANSFDGAKLELEELARALEDYAASLEVNPQEIARLEARIDLIEGLKRKYGPSLEEVIAHGEQAERKLHAIEGRGEELDRLQHRVEETRTAVAKHGKALSKRRQKSAPQLAKDISGHLEDLGFKQSRFELTLEACDEPCPSGLESVEFQFAPNPGVPFKPLRIIASSGEMSRVMLAVKSALAKQDQIPLLVFDEIDANVGGEIAHAVGKKMAVLGDQHQVIAITHMPQVASLAHHHYVVSKQVRNKTTRSLLKPVEGEQRVDEVARMLGGGGDSARALAESLLEP